MNKISNKFFFGLLGLSFVIGVIISLNYKADASVTKPTLTAGSLTITSGGSTTISWSSVSADGCGVISAVQSSTLTSTNFVGAGGSNLTGSFSTGTLTNTTSSPQTITFTVRCAVADVAEEPDILPICSGSYSFQAPLSACFTADTKIDMADGTTKNIQDVKIGDVLRGEKTNNTVLGFHRPTLESKLYSLNGGRYFVTEEHPFKTTNGWKSINPEKTMTENIGITVTTLKVGDTLVTDHGNVLLKTIDGKVAKDNTELYNFFLTGDHTYYADGYLVHNKTACDATHTCGGSLRCVDMNGLVIGSGSPDSSGMCASCPGSCPSGYTASCGSGSKSTICTKTCSGTPASKCSGTVVGSIIGDAHSCGNGTCSAGPYEGQSCTQFTTSSTCLQGWLTHGCTWSGPVS